MNNNIYKLFAYFLVLLTCLYSLCQSKPRTNSVILSSNFNLDKTGANQHSPIRLQQPLLLPLILTNPGQYKSNRPLFQKYSLRKYQLYDTNYLPDLSKLTRLQEQLAYNMEPPSGVFQQSSKIVIQNYRLLEIKEFKITLTNPSQRYRFCVEEIFIDSQEISRQQKRVLPFCLNSTTKYPFFFSLYITQHKPLIFKGTVYFIVTIYDGDELVDQKIWPKEIMVKVTHNHLRIIPLQIRNCNKDNSIVMIRNPQKWDLSLVIIYKRKLYELTGEPIDGNIIIPAQKSYKFIIDGKDSKMTIYTKSVATDVVYPVLYVPIYCIQDLVVDYFNIGILSDDRSLLQFPVTVSSYSNTTIYLQQISLKSSTQTVQLLQLKQNHDSYQIQPNDRHYIVARIIIHGSKANVQAQRSYFEVSIKYMMIVQNNGKTQQIKKQTTEVFSKQQQMQFEIRQTRNTFHYCQMRNPISVGTKRYIDVSKLGDSAVTSLSQNAFPIRNNLNLPINLIRVIYDESKFKLLWLQDKRDYVFPNHQRQQFSLQYIGPRSLQISPMRYVALLQFNGNLFIPLQVVIYDRTLQCVVEDMQVNKPVKCADISGIEFGYFDQPPSKQQANDQNKYDQEEQSEQQQQKGRLNSLKQPSTKIRRLTIRNWNPQSKNIKVGLQQNAVQKYGFNVTVRIVGPFPQYQLLIKKQNNIFELFLKGNHYIVVQIQMSPLHNATSGTLPLRILTPQQHITKPIKFKVQNGTIALIPQISRFQSSYKKTIEYLNLVSTYKQPYRIKSIHSNVSNLMVYCNNYSQIYQNQWIGMALIYQPFWSQWNITEECCGQRKGIQRLFKQLRFGGNRPIPVEITLKTTTQLEANALVLIDRSSSPLIQLPYSHQFSIRQKFRKDAQRIDIHLIDDGNVQRFQYKLKIRNIFQQTLKGNILMFDQQLIQRLDEYMQYRTKMNEKVITYFCLRNDVKVKHNFSPSLIKSLFHLTSLPLQITVQPLTNTSFYINSPLPPRQQVVDSSKFSEYFKQTINSGSRMCYRFESSQFIKNLIQTGVINWFSQQYRYQILNQFVKKQFQQIQASIEHQQIPLLHPFPKSQNSLHIKYHLQYEQFYAHHHIDREHFCKGQRNYGKMTSLFKFCQHINIKMKYLDGESKKYQRKQQKKFIKMEQCTNSTSSQGKSNKQCKKQARQKRMRRPQDKQVNKYFLLPALEKGKQTNQKLQKNQLQLGFEIYPIKNRAPIFTFSNINYRATIQNPTLSQQALLQKQHQQQQQQQPKKSHSHLQKQDPLFLSSPSFYLVLLNNYTSYQLYHQTIQISKPKLKIKNVIINGQKIQREQFLSNYFDDEIYEEQKINKQYSNYKNTINYKQFKNKLKVKNSHAQTNRWLPIYIDETQIKRNLIPNHYSNIHIQDANVHNQDSNSQKDKSGQASHSAFSFNPEEQRLKIKQMISNGDIDSLIIQGQRVFEITNQGQADITYTHIGFQNHQNTCTYKGFRVLAGPCTQDRIQTQYIAKSKQTQQNTSQNNNFKVNGQKYNKLNKTSKMVYKLIPKSSSLIKVRYLIPLKDFMNHKVMKRRQQSISQYKSQQRTQYPPISLYLYNSNSYYIQMIIKFKLSPQIQNLIKSTSTSSNSSSQNEKYFVTKIWNIALNVFALVFICATIIKFKQDEQRQQKLMLKKLNQESKSLSNIITNNKMQYMANSNNINYQKAIKKMKSKNQLLNGQQNGLSKENNEISYQVIQPSFYPFTIGNPISSKSSNSYHPIVTISEEFLNSIKLQQKKQSQILQNFFNQSEQSEILAKNQHQVNQNISLTINLDDQHENQNNIHKRDDSISQQSSFDFQIRNASHSQQPQLRKRNQSNSSGSDFSQASLSQLPEGEQVQVTEQLLNESGEGFGFQSSKKKPQNTSQHIQEENEDKKQGYYNVFFTQNPLKKAKEHGSNNLNNPFSWMNQNKKRRRIKW